MGPRGYPQSKAATAAPSTGHAPEGSQSILDVYSHLPQTVVSEL